MTSPNEPALRKKQAIEVLLKKEASTRERLNLIRDRADTLASELDALESGNAVPKGAAVHPASGVSVTHPASEILLDPRMPSDNELAQLLSIIRNDYPSLQPDGWSSRAMEYSSQDFLAFKLAARWLLDIGRGDLDLMHTLNFWANRVQGFAAFHGMKVQIGGNQMTCACIASGDVAFLNPDRYPSNLQHAGLKETYGGRPANVQAWRRVLAMGRAPAPSPFRPREYEKGGVVIRCAQ